MSKWDDLHIENTEKRFYGLDYGTSRSLFAYKEDSRPPEAVVPENQACRSGIPSLFWYRKSNSKPVVWDELLCDEVITYNGQVEDPDGVLASVKMRLTEDSVTIHGKTFQTEDIMCKQMQRIYDLSREELSMRGIDEDITTLVVGTPVRAGAYEKGKTLRAAEKIFPNARVMLLPEPYAAALHASSIFKGPLKTILVFDLGAGTFDTCVLIPNNKITPEDPYPYKCLAADGLPKAGDLFDELMEELLLKKLATVPNRVNLKILQNKEHNDRRALRITARSAKENLSNATSTTVMVTGTECGSAPVTVYRNEYEALIRPALMDAIKLSSKVLTDAGKWKDPNLTVLMVGGSSYIPLVKTLIQTEFSWLRDNQIIRRFPEQAIAMGCALFAEKPLVERKVAYGYAVDTYLHGTDTLVLDVRIPANCTLPCTTKATYVTRFDKQTGMRFNIYEVPDAEANQHLSLDAGTMKQLWLIHKFGKAVPKETPVELTTTLDQNGVLTLEADDHGISSQKKTKLTLNLSTQIG